jgi:hypothetical protein
MKPTENATVDLSRKDAEIIISALRTAPIQGSLDSLPAVLSLIAGLANRINDAFAPPQETEKEEEKEE